MGHALRSLLYAFHEDPNPAPVRSRPDPERSATRDLIMMVSELADRSGDYVEQVRAISDRADRM